LHPRTVEHRRIDLDALELAIEAEGLVKTFGAMTAVDGIDLAVRSGTVCGDWTPVAR
jgi:hypothetical protein